MYQVYGLKCSGLRNPEGIMVKKPEFSWKLFSDEKRRRQQSYRILVWNRDEECVWDSGTINKSDVFGVYYEGKPLREHTSYLWQVITTSNYKEQAVSEKASFTVGMLNHDWKAFWVETGEKRKPNRDCTDMEKIMSGEVLPVENPKEYLNPAVCIRKEIQIDKPIKSAYIYATAKGIYQLKVDGSEVSELLAPGYTSYKEYLEVQQYDVTQSLNQGSHALAVTLADGWYTGKIGLLGLGEQYGTSNAFYMQMEIEYMDGTRETIVSDKTFKWCESPYKYADLFVGSYYLQDDIDARWELPGYDDSDWKQVVENGREAANFKGREAEPVRVIRELEIKNIIQTPKGELVLDVGENIVGVLHIQFDGKANTVLRLIHSETLDKDGNFYRNIVGQNKNQTDVFVCSHSGTVEYKPEFTFHGFRYVLVEGITKEQILSVKVLVYGTDLDKTGEFTCSDLRLNQLQENIFRSQQGNMLSIPTDCPQREKAGWTGDMQVYAPTAVFNMDIYNFLKKWLANMRIEQLPDGQIPDVVPVIPGAAMEEEGPISHDSSAVWGDACVIIPYVLYMKYGRKEILEENYDMMARWMEYIERTAASNTPKPEEEYSREELQRQKYLWNTGFHFGDWLYPSAAIGMSDPFKSAFNTKEYVAAASWAYTTGIMTKISEILGKKESEKHYSVLNENIRKAYAEEYIDENGNLPLDLQGLYVLALAFDLFPKEKRGYAVQKLSTLIHENNDCLDTGFASVAFLLDTLWENGEAELAWNVLFQEQCPSWLYEVKQGATTIWETWNAILPDGTRTTSSFNHFSYGCVGDFMYRRILGIREAEPGYKKVDIDIEIPEQLTFAKGSYDSAYGKIEVSWRKANNQVIVCIMLPPNVSGVLNIFGKKSVLESGSTKMAVDI